MHRASGKFEPQDRQTPRRGRAATLCPFLMSALEHCHSGMRREAQARNSSCSRVGGEMDSGFALARAPE
ncbi:hypothetical protein EAS62_07695 [Bradyrhizobium zhanjiangense]|uniref:Uncharacterized protein n=1 Tax=Bradyrhizobium zhanjiangense TaxID=1325107 RepID=A0ABY0DQ09_9BRAD|nr:hypothetical protein EAS62_07695 [Bradyrhizobium zhanjiangense]